MPPTIRTPTSTKKEPDFETRRTYFGARYLDAEVGSWTATDPIGQYHNSYGFVGSDPINYIDLFGLESTDSKTDGGRTLPPQTVCPGAGCGNPSLGGSPDASNVDPIISISPPKNPDTGQNAHNIGGANSSAGIDPFDKAQSLAFGQATAEAEERLRSAGEKFKQALQEASRLSNSRNNNAMARMARRGEEVLSCQLVAQGSRMALFSKTLPMLKIGGATVAIGIGGAKILLAPDSRGRYLETAKFACSVGGAYVGALTGAWVGIPTTGLPGIAASVAGGMAGAEVGSWFGEKAFNFTFPSE